MEWKVSSKDLHCLLLAIGSIRLDLEPSKGVVNSKFPSRKRK